MKPSHPRSAQVDALHVSKVGSATVVGLCDGSWVGLGVGSGDGLCVGLGEGLGDGDGVGLRVDGACVGVSVGLDVHAPVSAQHVA